MIAEFSIILQTTNRDIMTATLRNLIYDSKFHLVHIIFQEKVNDWFLK